MARSPFEIGIASETKAFKQGIEAGVIAPLEDAVKQLRELGDDRNADKLERALKDAAKQTDKLADETRRASRAIEDDWRKTYAGTRRAADDGLDAMSERSREVGQEVRQNLGEGIANAARGDFEGLADVIGDTIGGATAGIGGLGAAAATAAGGVGLGLVIAAFNTIKEQEEAREQRAADWAQAYLEAGSTIISTAQIVAGVQEIAADPERYKQAKQNAEDWGVTEQTAMRAIAGDATALEVVRRTLNERTAEANRLLAEQEVQVDANAGAAYDLADAVSRGASAFSTLTEDMASGQARAVTVSDALRQIVSDAGDVQEEVDGVGNKLYTLPDKTQVLINAETGIASSNISAFQGDLDGIAETKNVDIQVTGLSAADEAVRRFTAGGRRLTIVADVVDKKGRQLLP